MTIQQCHSGWFCTKYGIWMPSQVYINIVPCRIYFWSLILPPKCYTYVSWESISSVRPHLLQMQISPWYFASKHSLLCLIWGVKDSHSFDTTSILSIAIIPVQIQRRYLCYCQLWFYSEVFTSCDLAWKSNDWGFVCM